MATISSITEGMSWSQAFGIINQVIAAVNALNEAVGGALVNGRIDYNSIVNRPQINSIELVGNLTQDQLNISLDSETLAALESFEDRVNNVEDSLAQRVTRDVMNNTLQEYAKTTDIPDVSGFATTAAMNAALAQKVDNSTRTADLASLNNAINGKADSGDVYTSSQITALLAEKEGVIRDLDTIRRGAAAGATAYQKPQSGIPASDMASAVQTSLGKADTAYQLPRTGIPKTDLESNIVSALDLANSAYQKPQTGIPASHMAVAVQTSLGKADSALQSHQSLNDYYTKTQADALLARKSNSDTTPSQNDWNSLRTLFETIQTAASASATAAGNSATAAASSASTCTQQCGIATQKAQEAASSAQSVSGAVSRIDALEATVNGTQQTTGLATRTSNLETKVGNIPDKVDITTDLKETREKSNEIIKKLQDDYNMIRDIDELVIAV